MKRLIKVLAAILFVLFLLLLTTVGTKLSYQYRVDDQIAALVRQDLLRKDLTDTVFEVDRFDNNLPSNTLWGNFHVRSVQKRIETIVEGGGNDIDFKNVIEISKDQGKTWSKFLEMEEHFCHYGTIYNESLYCLCFCGSGTTATKIDLSGKIEDKHLGARDNYEVIKVYRKGNELWMVWSDERARFPTLYAFLPIPHSASTRFGPYIIMAGRLNFDTLNHTEYVIKYDSREF